MTPIVSICVPNLNTLPYLPERFDSILGQTFQDWELIVYDSYSDDGAWEYIQAIASKEPRMRISQGPREGTPGSWNPCLRQARGKYVYIATSDDTMAPDFLERTVCALEAHPECDVAHAWLKVIGDDASGIQSWWENDSIFARSCNGLLRQTHTRVAPFDGLLHLSEQTVYISVTQLLVRRSLFDRVGYFESKWGSVGDFNWCMRAGLAADTVHVPQTWGGWRIHTSQATATVDKRSPAHVQRIDEMMDHAIDASALLMPPALAGPFRSEWVPFARDMRRLVGEAGTIEPAAARWVYHLRQALRGSPAARRHIVSRLTGRPVWPDTVLEQVREWLASAGVREPLLPCEDPAPIRPANLPSPPTLDTGHPAAVNDCVNHAL